MLAAFDAGAVERRAPFEVCRIHHNPAAGGAEDLNLYVMEFEAAGGQLRCPLVQFQPRMETVPPANGG